MQRKKSWKTNYFLSLRPAVMAPRDTFLTLWRCIPHDFGKYHEYACIISQFAAFFMRPCEVVLYFYFVENETGFYCCC